MILIADSGSTKTDWILIGEREENQLFQTKGFNPFFISSKTITDELKNRFPDIILNNRIKNIYFYGAGCSANEQKEIILDGIKSVFPESAISINTDILGAARALFFKDKGIAVILGTGANTCLYDGDKITYSIKSLGYIFGDEGGGDHIGKIFITNILNNTLPEEIKENFSDRFKLSNDQILRKVYSEPYPNKFLASFCEFISEYRMNSEVAEIIMGSFRLLFKNYISNYKDYQQQKIRIVGSIGYFFNEELNYVAEEYNCKIDLIIQKPIYRLAEFHTNYSHR